MSIKMALVGNPNCGKTTMFNAMTGANQYVGNWPGVTVEKKEGKLRGYSDVVVTDLPGIYSLSPYTLEEVVSRDYLINERPDAILNLVDATNLERNLYLTTQVLEMGIPVVVALNMMDLVRKNGDQISAVKLSEQLGCPVVEVSALKGTGLKELYAKAVEMAKAGTWQGCRHRFSGRVEEALEQIGGLIAGTVPQEQLCWYEVKLFERDNKVMEQLAGQELAGPLEEIVTACERELDDDSESIITNERYEYITSMLKGAYQKNRSGMTVSDRIDRIVTNRILALPIFVVVMGLVYAIAMGTSPAALFDGSGDPWGIGIGTFGTDWANDVLFGEIVPGWFDAVLGALNVVEGSVLYGLIQDGIVAGVGAVLGFVPQMLVLFLLLSVLEDCGYMARIAFIMDRIFRRFGLSGKSFIPMLVATGCGVPGIMASRTIEQDRDRKMTIMTTGFIPCGAKMPIIGLFAGALFGGSAWVATSAYFIGVAAVILSGVMLKKTRPFAGEPAPFVMELPAYHAPTAGNVLRATWERGWSFIKRAGTVILLSAILMWFLQGFGFTEAGFGMVEDSDHSLLAAIGSAIAVIFVPLGFGDWRSTVATFTGLVAKENVVATFGVLFQYTGEISEAGEEIWPQIHAAFTPIAAYSFMIFNLLCAPCFAAMGAIKREMNNTKWTLAAIGYMCGFAYVVSLIVYQLGGLMLGEVAFGAGTVAAGIALVALVYLAARRGYRPGADERLNVRSVANA